jgi:hypothetical protein
MEVFEMSFGVSHTDVVRYKKGDKLVYETFNGKRINVIAMGPGEPMEPGYTPVKVTARGKNASPFNTGDVTTVSNTWLFPSP